LELVLAARLCSVVPRSIALCATLSVACACSGNEKIVSDAEIAGSAHLLGQNGQGHASRSRLANFSHASEATLAGQFLSMRPVEETREKFKLPEGQEKFQIVLRDDNVVVSFDCALGHAQWVSWTVSESDLGSVSRSKEFYSEPQLPRSNCILPQPQDYSGSGYDRGHMAPSGDRTASRESNNAVFSMANIVPQAPQVNQKGWNDLENWTRGRVREGYDAIVFAGAAGNSGAMSGSGINLPELTWKVVALVPAGQSFAMAAQKNEPQVFGVIFPNQLNRAPMPLSEAFVSVDKVEEVTGFDLLSGLDQEIQKRIEQRKNNPL
jgi:endonuclease G